jgi:phenylacetate-coenzyme A ligase PaaK-like adenylate-forming protein
MFDIAPLFDTAPYGLARDAKETLYADALRALTAHHYGHCAPYRKMLDGLGFDAAKARLAADYPFLPVRLFKDMELKSVADGEVFKTMTSSGTGSQRLSKIFLDRATAANQTKALTKIVGDFIGKSRLPMLVIDSQGTVQSRHSFSARGAGILGFSMFGKDVTYALGPNMEIDFEVVEAFAEKHGQGPVLMFGFTFIVYLQFIKPLIESGRRLPLDNGILIHGGGWKKLIDAAIDNDTFKALLRDASGVSRVHNYYGMVEQTGSIFMECEEGHLHSSIYSDVIIRDNDFNPCPVGKQGLIELVSLLPGSYPGHVLLTEDVGTLEGEDDCPCGRKGRYFKVHGRIVKAEVRGCSDTFSRH